MPASGFDFSAPAELFVAKTRRPGRKTMDYRRFETAAEAIRHCIEEIPRSSLPATTMDVDGTTYRHGEIRGLYDSAGYPLRRQAGDGADGTGARPPAGRSPGAKALKP